MSLKRLSNFVNFDWESFAKDKRFMCTGCSEWKDRDTGKILGTAVEATIIDDKTVYYDKDGNVLNVTNRFEKINIKVKKDVNIPLDSIIKPINVIAKTYGDFNNQLSVKCDDVQVVPTHQRKVV